MGSSSLVRLRSCGIIFQQYSMLMTLICYTLTSQRTRAWMKYTWQSRIAITVRETYQLLQEGCFNLHNVSTLSHLSNGPAGCGIIWHYAQNALRGDFAIMAAKQGSAISQSTRQRRCWEQLLCQTATAAQPSA